MRIKTILALVFIVALLVVAGCAQAPPITDDTTENTNVDVAPLEQNTEQIVNEDLDVDIGDVI